MFFKKEACVEAMYEFWNWFKQNEQWIVTACKTDGMAVVTAVDQKLTPVFSYLKKEIEFELCFNEGKGEFFFFDLGNKNLNSDAKKLFSLMPNNLQYSWEFIIEH